jgi:signal recognition particle subunit SRP19
MLILRPEHQLYTLVAQYLKSHPTTEEMPKRLRIAGMPLPDKPIPPPAVPKGWKMGSILPLHSPALSGGGVSDNFFKEMMQEMQGQQGMPSMPGMPGMAPGMGKIDSGSGGEGKKKKDKKKGKA